MRNKIFLTLSGFILYFQGFTQNFYDLNTIQKIEINFLQADWDYQLDVLKMGTDKYLMADWVKINGVEFDSVGVKYKGSSSYDSTYKKNSLHIELNNKKDQSYQGYVDIKLGNSYSDPSMIREVLAYNILKDYMDCPAANFAELYINGTYMGIYSNAESINKKFCSDKFYSSNNTFIKCNPNVAPGPTVKSNLKYISNDSAAYKPFYEKKSKDGWNNMVNLCDTVTNFPTRISSILDVDKAIWMLAFNNLILNLDSYNGAFAQNYYLYKDNTGHFNPIIWDLNMSFGGFPFAGSPNNGMGTLSIANMQQFSPTYHDTHTDWPLINAVLQNPVYKKMYLAHMKTILTDYFTNGEYLSLAISLQATIDTFVQTDSNKFYSYAQFKSGLTTNVNIGSYSVPGISTLMDARATYLKSTSDFTQTAPAISNVTPTPMVPAYNAPVSISAVVTNTRTDAVFLGYKFDLTKKFEKTQMFDDGNHNDGAANDNTYGASINMASANLLYFIYAENNNAAMFSPERAEYEFYKLSIPTDTLKKGELVINEFLADNNKSDLNEYGVHSDWIELYNNTKRTLNLTGYYLSDNVTSLKKYPFDVNTTIEPEGYLMLWADELKTTTKYQHCGFNLSSSFGQVVFSNANGAILDSITYGKQSEDVSTGRCPNGTGNYTSIEIPTFKGSNNFYCANGIRKVNAYKNSISVYPNPANTYVTFASNSFNIQSLALYDLLGNEVRNSTFENKKVLLKLDGLNPGVYVYRIKDKSNQMVKTGKIIISK